jgi:hypothetical protein
MVFAANLSRFGTERKRVLRTDANVIVSDPKPLADPLLEQFPEDPSDRHVAERED